MTSPVSHSVQPVILCGGSGTRLWPLSRAGFPKQFLCLTGDESLFQQAARRLAALGAEDIVMANPLIVSNEDHRFLALEQLREIGIEPSALLLEPVGRNTAPALTLAALEAKGKGEDPILVVTPADQTVADQAAFTRAMQQAVREAATGEIVILGIAPDRPETGYGYINVGPSLRGEAEAIHGVKNVDRHAALAMTEGNPRGMTERASLRGGEVSLQPRAQHSGDAAIHTAVYTVAQFVEKPNPATAQRYLDEGGYYWNAGMFVLKASVWLAALEHFRPDIAQATHTAWVARSTDHNGFGQFVRPGKTEFAAIPAESIDYSVMEPLTQSSALASCSLQLATAVNPLGSCPLDLAPLKMVPLAAGWSDLGAWDAVWQALPKDTLGNAHIGDVITTDSRNTLVHANSRLVSLVGVKDLIVIETADAVLVADRNCSQDVKVIVSELSANGREEHTLHRKVHRPWGWYDGIDAGERFKVKRIQVKPGASLSLQKHHHRAEHWIVVKGTAEITCGDKVLLLTENQSTYIPLGEKHRLENPGKTPLEIIEVQSGSYLGEDDIVRYEDNYGRNK